MNNLSIANIKKISKTSKQDLGNTKKSPTEKSSFDLVEIVAPLFAINLQIHTNQKFRKSLIHKFICKTPFANHCIALQKCGYNVGTFADIMYLCIDEKFEHYGSFICT